MIAKNIFYLHAISPIGGVETYLYQIALKYGATHDIAVLYKQGDPDQIARLQKYVRTKRWDGVKRFECEKLFFGFRSDIAFYVDAKEYYFVMHCDYKAQNLPLPELPEGTHIMAVSEAVKRGAEEKFGIPVEVLYNPLVTPKPRKVLHLITASRLSPEKGGRRMETLCRALEKAGIPFEWNVFTNDLPMWQSESVIFRKPRLDITDYIADTDYLVQLSDTEGYSYSILEALSMNKPVIVTPLPCNPDMKIQDRVNAFVLPFDMTEIPIDEIYGGLPLFKYSLRKDGYSALLAKGKSNYEEEMGLPTRIRTKIFYQDLQLDRLMSPGEEQTVERRRAEYLEDRGFVEIVDDASV